MKEMLMSSDSSESNSSSSRLCGDGCAWEFDLVLGDWVAVQGCADPTKWCDNPDTVLVATRNVSGYNCVACYTPEELQHLATTSRENGLAVRRFGVIVPRIKNPKVVSKFTDVVVEDGVGQIITNYGWLIKVRHRLQPNEDGYAEPSDQPPHGCPA